MRQQLRTALLILTLSSPALAQERAATRPHRPRRDQPATAPASQAADDKPAAAASLEKVSKTDHEVVIAGHTIHYHATAANMLMKDEAGKLKANVFFVAYEQDLLQDDDRADRPITFVFNGGPGAAAVWLHLGTAGPRRIELLPDGMSPAPPHRLVENNFSWLDATDLVFIDPVGTGFSRPAEGEKGEQFYGVREDINWVGDFIRLYTTLHQRWLSPRFLAGESYGTTRAAALSEHLLDRYGIMLNGIMLISVVLDFQTLSPGELNDLPYVLFLPTYTASAWYHKRLAPELSGNLDRTLEEVRRWAITDYAAALALGHSLPAERRREIVEHLARYTGLPADLIEKARLRVGPGLFQKKLLEDEQRIIGRFDTRVTGYDPSPNSPWPDYDPSLSRYLPVYSATFNDYVRRELGYESVLNYEVLSDKVRPWKYGESGHGYLSVADELSSAMIKNPDLKVLFANGHYDLATPFFATEYTIDHLDLGPDLLDNIVRTYYTGGHMMYHNRTDLEKLHADITRFIRESVPR